MDTLIRFLTQYWARLVGGFVRNGFFSKGASSRDLPEEDAELMKTTSSSPTSPAIPFRPRG